MQRRRDTSAYPAGQITALTARHEMQQNGIPSRKIEFFFLQKDHVLFHKELLVSQAEQICATLLV
jgi:hypothetical protein